MKRTITVHVADADAYAEVISSLLELQEQSGGAVERVTWTCGQDIQHILKQDGWTPKWKQGSVHD